MIDGESRQPGVVHIVAEQVHVRNEARKKFIVRRGGGEAAGAGVAPQILGPETERFGHRNELESAERGNPQQGGLDQFTEADLIPPKRGSVLAY